MSNCQKPNTECVIFSFVFLSHNRPYTKTDIKQDWKNIPVLGHREVLQEGKPASSEALQGGDAVVVQMQLSEEDLVVQIGGLMDEQGEVVS